MTDRFMLVVSRFIYDLASLPKPNEEELNEEIDRLLYVTTAEKPNYLEDPSARDNLANLDSDVLASWIDKKFRPVLLMLILERQDNYQKSKEELCKMKRYDTYVNKFLRPSFVRRHAMKQVREYYFAHSSVPSIEHATADLKRLLTLISDHLSKQKNLTLLDTKKFTSADVKLYSYLKRIVLGRYRNDGLVSHVRLCDPLISFMRNYASKNSNIIDISAGDPLAKESQGSGLVTDIVKSASVGLGFVLLFLYLRMK